MVFATVTRSSLILEDVELFAASSLQEVRQVFAINDIDSVIIGAGIDIAMPICRTALFPSVRYRFEGIGQGT